MQAHCFAHDSRRAPTSDQSIERTEHAPMIDSPGKQAMDKPWDARLAALLVRPLLDSPWAHPNYFTTLRLLVGVAGATAFASGAWPNLGAALVVVSNFLDHTDGEFARMSGKTSRFGHYYDLVCDALVTVALFAGIGIGLAQDDGSILEMMLGMLAGSAVAIIFHLRNQIESTHGKEATRQPHWAGFEAEDVLYLIPLVTLCGGLQWFLYAAAIGAPLACIVVAATYLRVMREPRGYRV
jgi:phosphatidylglycerophosphate synthase